MMLPGLLAAAAALLVWAETSPSPIRFTHRPLGFTVESSETPERHAPETMAGGVAVFDFDNDGDLDIFCTNGADIRTLKKTSPKYQNRLFANDGKGNFTDVTAKAGLAGSGFDNGAAIGDYDNDGRPDIFVAGLYRNTLYHNNGDGTFSDVTDKAGLNHADAEYGPLWAVGGGWVDVNNDGLLDLFVVNYLSWNIDSEPKCDYQGRREYCHPKLYKKTPNQLFLNLGNGKFRDISADSGIRAHPGKGMGVGIADYDQDGLPDLFVTNDKVYNSFFHNKGSGKFEESAFNVNVALRDNAEFSSGMGLDFRDLDNDGYPDIFYVALDDETFPLFRNTGKGDFVDATRPANIATASLPMAGYSANIADFDNDGWKDIFVSRGHVQSLQAAPRITVAQHNSVFRNLGLPLKFAAYTAEAGFSAVPPSRHRGAAVGDFNGDGLEDVVVTALGAPAEIWINDSTPGNHWIAFSLEGVRSNRSAIGARIKLISKSGTQYDHVSTSAGYSSSSERPQHFGLGRDSAVERVEIRWPSGRVQQLINPEVDRVHRVREPSN
jgi:hypothetical protein